MNNTRAIVYGCNSCLTFFTDRSQLHANFSDHQNPPNVIVRLFDTARNVYQIEAAEIRINGSFLLDHEGENLQMRLAAVNCAGCQTECGWKIVILGISGKETSMTYF
ncbi:uncharacterized protein LOC104881919 isoform X2 [Vitis vinifera]|uniref:uncharacterized protein LOC104881919 isoform X2 n=1 Tax=Vitis vinifera TaxID=29760 RepID=UPI0008FEBC1D|nr:uncharacterized protein LOC104881919 isoform X2 [Vitis vinifera]|eukprot:XP_019080967.1 PREDICTED: uncharacterized protein LOC104881919 isoform X2 [Vitis vinifera]